MLTSGGAAMADGRFEQHMSDADTLMWNIEKDPLLRSTIVTVMLLDRSPDWATFVDKLERGSRLIPRMRQRVVTPMLHIGPPCWSADPDFDLSFHVRRVRAPEPGDLDSVLDLARRAAMSSFDRARPLFEYTLVEGLTDGRAALVVKVHHAMTDGVGGIRLLMMLLDLEREPAEAPPMPELPDASTLTPIGLVPRSLDHRRRRAIGIARRAVSSAAGATAAFVRDPVGTTGEAVRVARSVARFLEPATAARSPIMRARTLTRRLACFDVPLDDLRRSAKAVGGSLNDAFLAAVAGGLAGYHELHGAPVADLRMTMPINVRQEVDALGGNHFTPARFLVPLTYSDPAERVLALGAIARRVREEPAIALTDALAGVLNQLPTSITTAVFGALLKGADVVTSNIPGAAFPVYLGGAELERLYAFGPLSGSATNITLLSHNGTCCIGIQTDAVAIPDTETYVGCLAAGFDEILSLGSATAT